MIGPTSITSRSVPTTRLFLGPGRRLKERGVGLTGSIGETDQLRDRDSVAGCDPRSPAKRSSRGCGPLEAITRPSRSSIQKASSPRCRLERRPGSRGLAPETLGGDGSAGVPLEDLDQPISSGEDADPLLEMEELFDQQGLPVVGHRGEPVVDLIAEHLAGVVEPDRDQGSGRERDQQPDEQGQLRHDRPPANRSQGPPGADRDQLEELSPWRVPESSGRLARSAVEIISGPPSVGNSVIRRSVQP